MTDFTYTMKRTIIVPEYIEVKGKKVYADIDEDACINDEGKYLPPTIEYIYNGEENEPDWGIYFSVDPLGEFFGKLVYDGARIDGDFFYTDETSLDEILYRYVRTLEEM